MCVSTLEPRKNLVSLLQAFNAARYRAAVKRATPNLKLVVVGGRGWKYEPIIEALKPLVARGDVIHLENVSSQELRVLYSHAESLVFPSHAEGFGIPPLEAAANGCKVLCSNQTAMADFDFFGKYLFDPHNEEEFKQKILGTLSDERYPFEEIRRVVLEKYSWEVIAGDFGNKLKAIF